MSYNISNSRQSVNKRVPQVFGKQQMSETQNSKAFSSLIIVCAVVIILAQSIAIVFLLSQNKKALTADQILEDVATKTELKKDEVPIISIVQNAETLRNANAIERQVYKDAVNGDYILLYSGEMIIYRASNREIIYKGDTPAKIASNNQSLLVEEIKKKAIEKGLIKEDNQEKPTLMIVDDLEKLKKANPKFYENAKENDIVALFSESQIAILFRSSTKEVINSGAYTTSIK